MTAAADEVWKLRNGRVDWGTGESATALEMEGFNIPPEDKSAMWREAAEQGNRGKTPGCCEVRRAGRGSG